MTDQLEATQGERQVSELEYGETGDKDLQNPLHDQESSQSKEDAETLLLSPAEERKLLRRIDLAIVPYATL
jgi:hypothetical protein